MAESQDVLGSRHVSLANAHRWHPQDTKLYRYVNMRFLGHLGLVLISFAGQEQLRLLAFHCLVMA
jgi:hypothetical protein